MIRRMAMSIMLTKELGVLTTSHSVRDLLQKPLETRHLPLCTIASDTSFVMRADNQNVVAPGARGRDSIRISSYNAYDESVIILDVQHMPQGCSTWPAFWTLSQKGPWPQGGEIDIVEGKHSLLVVQSDE